MYYEKGPLSAIEVLVNGLIGLAVSPILFIISYISAILMLPINVLTTFFDFSTP